MAAMAIVMTDVAAVLAEAEAESEAEVVIVMTVVAVLQLGTAGLVVMAAVAALMQ